MADKMYVNCDTCTGCAACANACPLKAIVMRENRVGYYKPCVDESKCVNCAKCTHVCPEMNKVAGNSVDQDVYAIWNSDEIRRVSSSGGAFSAIAEWIFAKSGYIAGVGFDENWRVQHMLINDPADLDKLRRSKYVQSFISETFYQEVKALLDKDNWVLFTGVPCQVAALKSFLGKDYEKLVLMDLLCAQCASPKVFRKFLADSYGDQHITSVNFRSKMLGWDSHTSVTTQENPQEIINHDFMRAFVPHLTMNDSCKQCKYHNTERMGDITVGDFWGIGRRHPHLDDRRGTSCVILNTAKGKRIFDDIKGSLKLCEKLNMDEAKKSNWVLSNSFRPHPNMDRFNDNMDDMCFGDNVDMCLSKKFDVAVMGWFWVPNRGAILTNYALNEVIKELGYRCKTINFIPEMFRGYAYYGRISEKFAKKYLDLTRPIDDWFGLRGLNKDFDTFVVGSDQLWRSKFKKWPLGHLFLNFVNNKNKKISYSTSFGVGVYEGTEQDVALRKHWLSLFDAISVREKDGVDLLRDTFDVKGEFVLDPVFLIDKSKYEAIIQDSQADDKDFVAYAWIAPNEAKQDLVRRAEAHFGLKSVDVAKEMPVEDWLYYIKNCRFLITDSFHAACFATIFRKSFIVTNVVSEKASRFETLFSLTGMPERLLYDPSQIDGKEYLFNDPDWTIADETLPREIARSKKWLADALSAPKKPISPQQEINDAILIDLYNKKYDLESRFNRLGGEMRHMNALWMNRRKIYFKYCKYRLLKHLGWRRYVEKCHVYRGHVNAIRDIKRNNKI